MLLNKIDKYIYEININDNINRKEHNIMKIVEKISKMDSDSRKIYISNLDESVTEKLKIFYEGGLINE